MMTTRDQGELNNGPHSFIKKTFGSYNFTLKTKNHTFNKGDGFGPLALRKVTYIVPFVVFFQY